MSHMKEFHVSWRDGAVGKAIKVPAVGAQGPEFGPQNSCRKAQAESGDYTDNLSTDEAERWIGPAILA